MTYKASLISVNPYNGNRKVFSESQCLKDEGRALYYNAGTKEHFQVLLCRNEDGSFVKTDQGDGYIHYQLIIFGVDRGCYIYSHKDSLSNI